MNEEWTVINGFPLYEISTHGRVRSNIIKNKEPRLIKLTPSTRGYVSVRIKLLKNEPAARVLRVHRLVAEHFIPDADMSLHVDHIDENKSNNKIDNLRLCTATENNVFFAVGHSSLDYATNKSVSVNGSVFTGIYSASKFIFANTDRDVKFETIRREVAAIARGQCKPRNMYGRFLIAPA